MSAGDGESVCVGVRVRPFNDREKELKAVVCIKMNGPKTSITNPEDDETKDFTFDASFWSHDGFEDDDGYSKPMPGSNYADQQHVYERFGKRVLDNAWAGFHCCLFAYGQTGAGKSYSMVGYGKNKGIVPISCEEIFNRIENGGDSVTYEVTCSMIEIYNETVHDLLILPQNRTAKGLDIRESKLLGTYIDGVTQRKVESYEEIEEAIEEATDHRTVGSTLMNATSSRAHTVVTINFKQFTNLDGVKSQKVSTINLVDLAGSEKAGQTGATGSRLKEGAAINKSLSALGVVIEKLAAASNGKANVVIPYRDSKLTRLLQNALGGSSKTIMICALSPASSNYQETLSTLRYADRAKQIKNKATVNENPQDALIRTLKEENANLKKMMEDLMGGKTIDFDALKLKSQEIHQAEQELKDMERCMNPELAAIEEEEEDDDGPAMTKQPSRKSVYAEARKTMQGAKLNMANMTLTNKRVPHLLNLDEDRQLSGRIRHDIGKGENVIFNWRGFPLNAMSTNGDGDEVVVLQTDDTDEAVRIENENGTCTLKASVEHSHETFINGAAAADLLEGGKECVPLVHGDRVAFGFHYIFVFSDPKPGVSEEELLDHTYASAHAELARARTFMLGVDVGEAAPSKASLYALIAAKNKEVKELREENNRLRENSRLDAVQNAVLEAAAKLRILAGEPPGVSAKVTTAKTAEVLGDAMAF
eukprot:TRINITY_DN3025_c1_g4_i1.p1 TRINITY_DN3025_c1_g4~~TRINITY_DN3025_c1_g4_i1.p1  ORF type:complete len:706 (+),score=208.90 TRINITY_DN3025_c1_g4_i1:208-2325(+)